MAVAVAIKRVMVVGVSGVRYVTYAIRAVRVDCGYTHDATIRR